MNILQTLFSWDYSQIYAEANRVEFFPTLSVNVIMMVEESISYSSSLSRCYCELFLLLLTPFASYVTDSSSSSSAKYFIQRRFCVHLDAKQTLTWGSFHRQHIKRQAREINDGIKTTIMIIASWLRQENDNSNHNNPGRRGWWWRCFQVFFWRGIHLPLLHHHRYISTFWFQSHSARPESKEDRGNLPVYQYFVLKKYT